jgi:hypothetical protein
VPLRVRFFCPTDERETAAHLTLQRRIEAFWKTALGELCGPMPRGRSRVAVNARLAEAAHRVDASLLAEIVEEPGGRSGEPTLVVSHSGDAAGGALADAVVRAAPRAPPLRVARYRSPRPVDAVLAEVRDQFGLDLGGARARAGFSRGHLLEIVRHAVEVQDGADPRALDAANLAVMSLLGEERFDDWVGSVDVAPMPRPSSLRLLGAGAEEAGRFSLGELPLAVDAAIAGLERELATAPYHTYCERADWTLLDVEPDGGKSAARQDDLLQCVTMLPEMSKCFLSDMRFSSRRFSAHGERFVYLKVDAVGLDVRARHALQLALEDALNYALVPGRFGCVVAAGLGLGHVYLTLALQDLDGGIELAARTARKQGLTERAWILFCDSAWRDEWVGVHDHSPVPPGM